MATNWRWSILAFIVAFLAGTRSENLGDTTPGEEEDFGGSTSPISIIDQTTDRLINGDLRKAARVEPLPGGKPSSGDEQYDVIDVLESTGTVVGKPKSGQTTRIYTTGEVDENFWLKHLGDDFRHAIHLQVGGTNEEYNRLINQTQNGVHEEVHHEYLPGAERPGAEQSAYGRGQSQNFDNRAVASKQQYLMQQRQQKQQQRYNYAQQYTPNTQQQYTPNTQHTPQQHQQQYQPQTPHRNMRYPKNQQQPQRGYIINSSEDQLHAAQSNPSVVRSSSSSGGGPAPGEERESFGSQLPFKSPFNDYGSRPTRDLTYLLYKRGL
ncbi:uncharacterized protein Cp7Fc [Drosophila bipectinata]|uniref:uncharacterized protein Cp7Fc n=1 Tax=Drosophila bipectinata TaxID=42026 RepID=UPI001C8A8099|nr:uncharacterized protein LOC108123647 [Drosophila bipectinata]